MTDNNTVKIDDKFQLMNAKVENLKEIVSKIIQKM
jgi:hypothetical protein